MVSYSCIPLNELIVKQRLSRTLDGYKSPSPAARAALQLQEKGRQIAAGQLVEFLCTRGGSGVHAWEFRETLNTGRLDTDRYCALLDRAMHTVLVPCKLLCANEKLL